MDVPVEFPSRSQVLPSNARPSSPWPSSAGAASVRTDRRALVVLLAVLLLSVGLRARIAPIPLERDEGAYAYIAQRWLAGDVPYRDAFEPKLPGVFLAYAALFATTGATSPAAIHWFGHIPVLGTLVLLFLIGRRLFVPRVGWVAALIGSVLLLDPSILGQSANTELFAVLPLTTAFFLALHPDQTPRRTFSIGLAGGLAFLCKQTVLPIAAATGIIALVQQYRSRKGLVRAAGLFLLGLLLAPALTAFAFFQIGVFRPFVDATAWYAWGYRERVPLEHYDEQLLYALSRLGDTFWVILPALALGLVALARRRDRAGWCGLGWWLSSAIAVSLGGYFRPHYFTLMIPTSALVIAYGFNALGSVVARGHRRWTGVVTTVLALAATGWPIGSNRDYYFAATPALASMSVYRNPHFTTTETVANIIRARSSHSDTVFIFGSEPQILFTAVRRSASRYIYLYPLYDSGRPDTAARQREVVGELRRAPPRIVVTVHRMHAFEASPEAPVILADEIRRMLGSSYTPVTAVKSSPTGETLFAPPSALLTGPGPVFRLPDPAVVFQVWERQV